MLIRETQVPFKQETQEPNLIMFNVTLENIGLWEHRELELNDGTHRTIQQLPVRLNKGPS